MTALLVGYTTVFPTLWCGGSRLVGVEDGTKLMSYMRPPKTFRGDLMGDGKVNACFSEDPEACR